MKMNDVHNRCCKKLCALVLALVIVALPMGGAMAGNKIKGRNGGNEEGPRLNSKPMAEVRIEKKMLEAVVTNVGKRFALSKETIITGLDGQQVDIRKMLVPCEARITYETKKGVAMARHIKVLRIDRDSTWKWEYQNPD